MQLTPLLAAAVAGLDLDVSPPLQRRVDARSNIFLVAAMTSGSASGAVRIRNMSTAGALIEGEGMPAEGAGVAIHRGTLSASGQLVWRSERRAGIRFDSPVHVADWLPRGSRSTGQQKVDQIVQDYKAGRERELAQAVQRPNAAHMEAIDQELAVARRELGTAVEDYSAEDCPTRRLIAVQAIDVAAQKLQEIAARMRLG